MGLFTHLKLKYADFKSMKTAISGTIYYTETDLTYELFLIDTTNGLVSRSELVRDPSNSTDATDFETNFKSTAVAVANVDTAIARKVGGF